MREVSNAVEFYFQRDGNLLLDFLGGMSWPLGDDLCVGVGNVRISLDGQSVE